MKQHEIGGYFELELNRIGDLPHSTGICVNSGRNALEYILMTLPAINKVWIPYFTCDVVLEPFHKLNIPYSFYSINSQLELNEQIKLEENEYLLINNYFGIKDSYIKQLADIYKDKLIVDNSQALYAEKIPGINTFYSPRKFVGVPDGGIAFSNYNIDINQFEIDQSFDRCSHLLKRIDLGATFGYNDFKNNYVSLKNQPIKQMSRLTKHLFSSISHKEIKKKRIENFQCLSQSLSHLNLLDLPSIEDVSCPMVYPLLINDDSLREKLIKNNIFVATYWPNIFNWCNTSQMEYKLSKYILPIPIDQRYNIEDMNRIINILKNEK